MEPASSNPAIRALLLCDLVASTQLVERVGDSAAAEVLARHDRAARDLLPRFNGREIDKSDGFLLLFERSCRADAPRLGLVHFWTATGKWPDCADEVPYGFRAECAQASVIPQEEFGS